VRPYLEKNPLQKRAGGLAQGVGPKFKPQYHKKRKKNKWKIFTRVLFTVVNVKNCNHAKFSSIEK
jgi:hypothetical protein